MRRRWIVRRDDWGVPLLQVGRQAGGLVWLGGLHG